MPIPSINDLLNTEVTEAYDKTPIPVGVYDAVLTAVEVRQGPKGPYLNIEATLVGGDHDNRKVWGISSFSEKAIGMPGGVANLLQVVNPDIDRGIPSNEVPAAMAKGIGHAPVSLEIEHEQIERNGSKQFYEDGTPEMKDRIRQYFEPSEEFIETVAVLAAGGDDDLPF